MLILVEMVVAERWRWPINIRDREGRKAYNVLSNGAGECSSTMPEARMHYKSNGYCVSRGVPQGFPFDLLLFIVYETPSRSRLNINYLLLPGEYLSRRQCLRNLPRPDRPRRFFRLPGIYSMRPSDSLSLFCCGLRFPLSVARILLSFVSKLYTSYFLFFECRSVCFGLTVIRHYFDSFIFISAIHGYFCFSELTVVLKLMSFLLLYTSTHWKGINLAYFWWFSLRQTMKMNYLIQFNLTKLFSGYLE